MYEIGSYITDDIQLKTTIDKENDMIRISIQLERDIIQDGRNVHQFLPACFDELVGASSPI